MHNCEDSTSTSHVIGEMSHHQCFGFSRAFNSSMGIVGCLRRA
jgi:hypothetical protein